MRRVPPEVADAVWARDRERCFRCSRRLRRGQGGYSIHHRQPGGMGGAPPAEYWRLSRVVLLCGSATTGCHHWVESHRTEAKRQGLLVDHPTDPATVSVIRWQRQVVFLADDATVAVS